ncbi:ester cyclase [Nguyenibacter sp. L1]|uniref:ester cyclase n=1 Tax=Nguyenibacter sp. L1 TaxID=3049350 RepID=UPI002B4630A5|nr:ester cyclase [Nguyenibacter sp. L1]WRH86671.1 ester cyclase [Nguyenibacter sp. L1]
MSERSRKTRLRHFIHRVWNQGDADSAATYLAPTYRIRHDPGDPWNGMTLDLAGFKARVIRLRAAFPDQHFDIQGLYADGDTVVMTWLWNATHLGDLPDFPATGHTIEMSGATAYGFDRSDMLTGHWQVTDRLGVYQQLQRNKLSPRPDPP